MTIFGGRRRPDGAFAGADLRRGAHAHRRRGDRPRVGQFADPGVAERRHLTSRWQAHSYSITDAWFRDSHDGAAFIDAVHHLADTLDLPTNTNRLIDYQRRRTVLTNWRITAEDWHTITTQVHRGRHTDLGERKHNTASALVWTTVTSGEHLFAPHRTSPPGTRGGSTEDRGLSIDRAWYRARTNKPGRHYPHLSQLLDELAQRVARQIDRSPPDPTSGQLTPVLP